MKVMPFLPLCGGKARVGHFHKFHTYHNVGGNYVGIIADRFDEEHLGSKAKLSWKPPTRFVRFNQLLAQPNLLPA